MSDKKSDSERIRDIAPLGIRLPLSLKQRLTSAAKLSGKSMNRLVVDALEEAFPQSASRERDLFLTKAVCYMMLRPEYVNSSVETKENAIKSAAKFVKYMKIKFPELDPEEVVYGPYNEDFGEISIVEVFEKVDEINEVIDKYETDESPTPTDDKD